LIRADSLPVVLQAALYALLMGLVFYSSLVQVLLPRWLDENANYGILVLPAALYLLWEKSNRLAETPSVPWWPGFYLFLSGVGLYIFGRLGGSSYVSAIAAWPVFWGVVFSHAGRHKARTMLFPALFRFAAVPIPAAVFDKLVSVLQLTAAAIGAAMARAMGIAVFQDKAVIDIGTDALWLVVEACSGIRYLIPIVLLTTLLAYFYLDTFWKQALLVALSVPATLFSNAFRIALTFYLHETAGPETAKGFFHEFSGWLIFMMTFGFLGVGVAVLRKICGSGFRVQGSRRKNRTEGIGLGAGNKSAARFYEGRLRRSMVDEETNRPTAAGWKRVLLEPPQFLPAVTVLAVVWMLA
jgi:exosortase